MGQSWHKRASQRQWAEHWQAISRSAESLSLLQALDLHLHLELLGAPGEPVDSEVRFELWRRGTKVSLLKPLAYLVRDGLRHSPRPHVFQTLQVPCDLSLDWNNPKPPMLGSVLSLEASNVGEEASPARELNLWGSRSHCCPLLPLFGGKVVLSGPKLVVGGHVPIPCHWQAHAFGDGFRQDCSKRPWLYPFLVVWAQTCASVSHL